MDSKDPGQEQKQDQKPPKLIVMPPSSSNKSMNYQQMSTNIEEPNPTPLTKESSSLTKPNKMGNKQRNCAYCGLSGRFKKCGACHSVYYCSKEHQVDRSLCGVIFCSLASQY
jgi:hypothetical protein